MSEAARSHRSDPRVEPYMEPPGAIRSNADSPLAELARLVGQDDPFRAMFRQGKAPPLAAAPRALEEPDTEAPHASFTADGESHDGSEHAAEEPGTLGLRPSYHEDVAPAGHWDDGHDQPEPLVASHEGDPPQHDHAVGLPVDAPHYVAPPLTPDIWARQPGDGEEPEAEQPALSDEKFSGARASRRPLVVLAAVLALTGGGLAATFLSRSGSSAVVYSGTGAAPTILAATGPTKIKQSDSGADTTPEDADAALLNKNGASSGGPVKVVNSQEQPIDLAQLPKPANAQPDAPAASSSPFPAPKKVKTFLVRPDGSLVNSPASSGAASSTHPSVPQLAIGAIASGDASDNAATPSARPSTPKGSSHAATTPKAPPATSIADTIASQSANAESAKAKQPASPGAKPAGRLKAVEVADASAPDTTAAVGPGGSFGLQLAASPSEEDARSAFVKLQKKYSELGAYQPTVKKVDNGQKTVYRLRVSNLSQDQAKTLCSQLQASGGSCFVVRN